MYLILAYFKQIFRSQPAVLNTETIPGCPVGPQGPIPGTPVPMGEPLATPGRPSCGVLVYSPGDPDV